MVVNQWRWKSHKYKRIEVRTSVERYVTLSSSFKER